MPILYVIIFIPQKSVKNLFFDGEFGSPYDKKLSPSGESGAHAPKGVHFLKELDRVDFFQGAARSYYFLSPSHKFPNDQDTI